MPQSASETSKITFHPDDRFVINPLFMFRWEETQNAHVLLYPEGVVKLNQTAGEILKCCDGEQTLQTMTESLKNIFSAGGAPSHAQIEDGIIKFLEVSHAKGWIRRKA